MTYGELREKLNSFVEHQLATRVVVFENDEEIGKEIDSIDEQEEDMYWHESECMGGLKEATEWLTDNPNEGLTIADFKIIAKGTPTLHIFDSLMESSKKD